MMGRGAEFPVLAGAPPDFDMLLQQRESLREVIESISSELELRPLLTRIIRHACELLGGSNGSIGLHDEARGVVRMEAVFNMPEREIGVELPRGVGLSGQVLETLRPVILERYEMVKVMTASEFRDRAVIGVPILWHDRLIGTFGIGAPPPRRFTDHDIEILTLFARHAAIAIQNARQYHREALRNERLALLARVGRNITAALDLDTLCEHAVQLIHELLGYPYVAIGLLEPEDPHTIVIRHRGGHNRDRVSGEHRFHISQGVMGAAVREGRIQMVDDVRRDPRYVPSLRTTDVLAELDVPIRRGETALGVLNLESRTPFTSEDATSLQIIADHLAVAISNARLFADARRLAVLEERQRLARDLHDSITQMIFSASLIAQSINPAWQRDPREGERLTERVVDLTRTALTELRAVLHELRPESPGLALAAGAELPALARLRRDGLAACVRFEAQRVIVEQLACELDLAQYPPQSFEIEEVLYRVFQEALNNVIKHARATWVRVRLGFEAGHVILVVADDGVGFDPAPPAAGDKGGPGGFGMETMNERVALLGGTLHTFSQPGRGTTIEAFLPTQGEP